MGMEWSPAGCGFKHFRSRAALDFGSLWENPRQETAAPTVRAHICLGGRAACLRAGLGRDGLCGRTDGMARQSDVASTGGLAEEGLPPPGKKGGGFLGVLFVRGKGGRRQEKWSHPLIGLLAGADASHRLLHLLLSGLTPSTPPRRGRFYRCQGETEHRRRVWRPTLPSPPVSPPPAAVGVSSRHGRLRRLPQPSPASPETSDTSATAACTSRGGCRRSRRIPPPLPPLVARRCGSGHRAGVFHFIACFENPARVRPVNSLSSPLRRAIPLVCPAPSLPFRFSSVPPPDPQTASSRLAPVDMSTATMLSGGRELSQPPSDGISNLRFSSHSDLLLVSSWDRTIRLYDVGENTLKAEFVHAGPVLDCCFHDDSSGFSAGADHSVRRHVFGSGKEDILGHHDAPVRCVEYSYAAGQVITGSWDKTLKCWDPRGANSSDRALIGTYVQPERVYSLSLVGYRLVVATAGRHVNVYDLRNMSQPEQRRESSLKYQTRCVRCYPNGTGFTLSSIEGRVAMEFFDLSEAAQAKKYVLH
ncbi:hypothetical protein ZIOFF_052475 [Zingiber officinale]|uniref:Mitotic checkpoint protein BUB3.1 n=1 Tax=Zingiber officinale TaxID=94328 RepID=A0A8J5FNL5_ZINOF|nr:hypothetical protein ZIOFF_052475 [Zingiber officinale]